MRGSWLFFVLVVACGSDGGTAPNGDGGTGGTDDCPVGFLGCPCVEATTCNGDLVCNDTICEMPGEDTCLEGTLGCRCGNGCELGTHCETDECVKDEPVVDTSCVDHDDCAGVEMCVSDECVPIDALYFDVTVNAFIPETCEDGALAGAKELYFDYYQDFAFELSSPTVDCPGEWEDFSVVYDTLQTFELRFWDEDLVGSELQATFCWPYGLTVYPSILCGVVPDDVLRDGEWSESTDAGTVELTFTVSL